MAFDEAAIRLEYTANRILTDPAPHIRMWKLEPVTKSKLFAMPVWPLEDYCSSETKFKCRK